MLYPYSRVSLSSHFAPYQVYADMQRLTPRPVQAALLPQSTALTAYAGLHQALPPSALFDADLSKI